MTERFEEGHEPPPRGVRAMGIVRWLLIVALAAIALGSVLAYHRAASKTSDPHAKAVPQMYHCPMHPQIVSDRAGTCPICSMDLVPVEAAAADPHDDAGVPGLVAVHLDPARVQRSGIKTAQVSRTTLGGALRAVATLATDERKIVVVTARYTGFVEQLLVAETGRRVKKGQVLATIYSPEVLRAQQELLTASRWRAQEARERQGAAPPTGAHQHLTTGQGLDGDARKRLELMGVASEDIEAILRKEAPIEALPLRAPADGVVVGKTALPGASVSAGAPLYELADLSEVWALADVFESDVTRVRVGQRASLELPAYPGETFTGKVQFVSPMVDAAARTLRVRLSFANRPSASGPKLRPGMFGHVSLALPEQPALAVPRGAVIDTGDAQYVFVAKPEGRFEPRRVVVAGAHGDSVALHSGVSEGESVVTSANFLVDSESRLRAAVEGL